MSIKPDAVVYGGPQARDAAGGAPSSTSASTTSRPRVTLRTLRAKYAAGERITMVTAYDYPSATHVDAAGVDVLLVGDSAAMVVHGHDTTLPLTVDAALLHCQAVARGARTPLLVGDLPFGSYEASSSDAVRSAVRMLKEGGMDAVKLEGGGAARVAAAAAVVGAGVAVMGHVGLMPQAISVLGGFRPQGQSAASALKVLKEARALQDAGCFAVVLECVPAPLAAAVTAALRIPTIGIGAGPHTSGQVLVYHDLLGMMAHPHYRQVTPKFCKKYAQAGELIQAALGEYADEVRAGTFPGPGHTPYRLDAPTAEALAAELRKGGETRAAEAVEAAVAVQGLRPARSAPG